MAKQAWSGLICRVAASSNNRFQCQYGLCSECIVYLCNNDNTILSEREIEQVMISRGIFDKGIHPSESTPD
ncbi:MAG TPA: hypothetical protein ENN06_08020 [Desulfobacteraceae bacterium]|nr:hypothetical protein [Desulfobacteraceae bacterium]